MICAAETLGGAAFGRRHSWCGPGEGPFADEPAALSGERVVELHGAGEKLQRVVKSSAATSRISGYSGSPVIGTPMELRWTRSWWVRPVIGCSR